MDANEESEYSGAFSIDCLYQQYHAKLRIFFIKKGLGWDVAEDLTQEAFYRLLRCRKSLQDEDYARNLLYRTAQNLAIDYFRKNHGSIKVEPSMHGDAADEYDAFVVGNTPDPEESFISDETSSDVMSVVSNLPPRYLEAIMMREFEGLSYVEMATRMGVSEKAAESLLHRARSHLKQDLALAGEERGGWWSGIILGLRNRLAIKRTPPRLSRKILAIKTPGITSGVVSLGLGKAIVNLVVVLLVMGSIAGTGVAVAVQSLDGSPETNAASVNDLKTEVQPYSAQPGLEGSSLERALSDADAPGGGNAMDTLQREGGAIPCPDQVDDVSAGGIERILQGTDRLLDQLLASVSDLPYRLLDNAAESVDKLLADIQSLIIQASAPVFDFLKFIGMPEAVVGDMANRLNAEVARKAVLQLVDHAAVAGGLASDLSAKTEVIDGSARAGGNTWQLATPPPTSSEDNTQQTETGLSGGEQSVGGQVVDSGDAPLISTDDDDVGEGITESSPTPVDPSGTEDEPEDRLKDEIEKVLEDLLPF